MTIVDDQLAAACAYRDRVEAEVWTRAGLDDVYPSDRDQLRPYLASLEALMTRDEWKAWRATCITIEEVQKHLP